MVEQLPAIIIASGYLRAELPDLLPDEWETIESRLAETIDDVPTSEPSRLAASIRTVVEDYPQLASRLSTLEDLVSEPGAGQFVPIEVTRGIETHYQGLPGLPGPIAVQIWTCPLPPDAHCLRLQRFPDEAMRDCPTDHVPLVAFGG